MSIDEFPKDLRATLRHLPLDQRARFMNDLFRTMDEEVIEEVQDFDVEPDEITPTDCLTWLQRKEAREDHPHNEHSMRTQAVFRLFKERPSWLLDRVDAPSSYLLKYADYVTAKHGNDAGLALLQSTCTLIASSGTLLEDRFVFEHTINGLVVGSIQSGKSASFIGLASGALDLGAKVIVVYSGTTDKLRNQTQTRVMNDLILQNEERLYSPTEGSDLSRYNPNNPNSAKYWSPLKAACIKHLRKDGNALVIVTKKNHATLDGLNTLLECLNSKDLLGNQPILMIDDECDHSSINSLSELWDGTPRTSGSRIHTQIVGLRTTFPSIYWGYTATPQAQVFQHPHDRLAPQSVHVLEPHKHYLGPLEVFEQHRHIMVDPCSVTDFNLSTRGADAIQELRAMRNPPQSLVTAMLNHAVSGALHRLQPRRVMPHKLRHAMMVHIIRDLLGQDEVYRLVVLAKAKAIELLEQAKNEECAIVRSIIARFRQNRQKLRSEHISLPRKSVLLENALNVLDTSELRLLNSRSPDKLDYDDPKTPNNLIVIGGDVLSRGLTIEGLRTTMFLREPSSAIIDSALQTARWFGPLREDQDLISIHMRPTLAERFTKIAWSDAQLRDQFRHIQETGQNVADAKIMHHPGYQSTSKAKRRNGALLRSAGDRVTVNQPWMGTNGLAIQSLQDSLVRLSELSNPTPILGKNARNSSVQGLMFNVSIEDYAEFLKTQTTSFDAERSIDDCLRRIRSMQDELGEDAPRVNIVLRNGSGKLMDDDLPCIPKEFGLRRVIRKSTNHRTIDQLVSGRTKGQSIYTGDWYIDGFEPTTATAHLRGWRTTNDPLMCVIYVVDEYTNTSGKLRGVGPWIGYIMHFPQSGPGGSVSLNVHRTGGEEE
ncbi:Z1 domain-containing protein [Candidatus Poseidoniaceae archaeon]|nr:Z1 domain-containing protein [Candidatus Poseidoniaceae archaeon]